MKKNITIALIATAFITAIITFLYTYRYKPEEHAIDKTPLKERTLIIPSYNQPDEMVGIDSLSKMSDSGRMWIADKDNKRFTVVMDTTASLMVQYDVHGQNGIELDSASIKMFLPHFRPKRPSIGSMYMRIDTAYYFFNGKKWKRIYNFDE